MMHFLSLCRGKVAEGARGIAIDTLQVLICSVESGEKRVGGGEQKEMEVSDRTDPNCNDRGRPGLYLGKGSRNSVRKEGRKS